MRMTTMMPAASRIFFLFEGFFGGAGTAVGMDEGISGVCCMSFGEKSFGIKRFFVVCVGGGTLVVEVCSGTTILGGTDPESTG